MEASFVKPVRVLIEGERVMRIDFLRLFVAAGGLEPIEMLNQDLRDAVGGILRNPVIDVFDNLKLIRARNIIFG